MRAWFKCGLWFIALWSWGSFSAVQDKIKVTFLSPVEAGKPFWHEFETAMMVAAEQLNIDLHIERLIYEEHNRFSVYERYQRIATAKNKPDYFISFLQRKIEHKSFILFEDNQLNFISVNTGLSNLGAKGLGLPRQKFKHWIGHVSPDDFEAGRALMHHLFQAKKSSYKGQPLKVLAYSGPAQSEVANQRVNGLMQAVREINYDKNYVDLLQALPTPWRGEVIGKKTTALLKRHGLPDIIWTPSDVIALDVVDAIASKYHKFNIGSFDWSERGLALTERELMSANMGGHFMDGAWSLVLAYDHFHQQPLSDSETGIFYTEMMAIDSDNAGRFRTWLKDKEWTQTDFRQFSKKHNPDLASQGYQFSVPVPSL